MRDVIGCETVCGDRLYMPIVGCKINNKHRVTVSYRVNVCQVREEVDNDLGQFVLS